MSGCQTCGGFGMRHDPIAHDAEPQGQYGYGTHYESHIWSPRFDGDEDDCMACGVMWTDCDGECPGVTL